LCHNYFIYPYIISIRNLMKKIVLTCFFLYAALGALRAAVLTLNNNTPTPGQYTTFAAAQTAAAAGDTILVQGSPTSYGAITISKRLTIIGPGHKPNTLSGLGATFGPVTISDNLKGVGIYGIIVGDISGLTTAPYLKNVDSLIIENVYFFGSVFIGTDCNNILIRGSVFNGSIALNDSNATDLIVENNYVSSTVYGGLSLLNWGGTGNKLVSNNIFAWSGAGSLVSGSIRNTIFQNNIFYGLTANSGTQTDCLYANNLSFGHNSNNTLPPAGQGGSNNLVNTDPKIVNIQLPTGASAFSYTRNYRLQADSPCKGAGIGGTDIGLYEPDYEFSMTGEPKRPQALTLNPNPVVVPTGGTTTVNFTIRKSTVNAQ
jgi:hypothetical protein